MPLKNALNVSELLKRLGVSGDSLGSADVLEALRLGITIADLSRLVPPLSGPVGAASSLVTAAPVVVNQRSLHARSAGGLQVLQMGSDPQGSRQYDIWITAANPFGVLVAVGNQDLAFGQVAASEFAATQAAAVAPANSVRVIGSALAVFAPNIWLGPGQFLNIEHEVVNTEEEFTITWAEYTGMLNP